MPATETTTVLVVPWYERRDFDRMRRMPAQGRDMPSSYDAWLDRAFQDMRELLARGCALKIVTIHLDDYLAWLEDEGAPDSVDMRSRYIRELSLHGSQLSGARLDADTPWPSFPRRN